MTDPKHTNVTLTRLAQLLDAYGAEASRWPEEERQAAQRLLQSDPQARALYASACSVDSLLDSAQLPPPRADLRARVLEVPLRHARAQPVRARWFGLRLSLLALVPCALGFLGGSLWGNPAFDAEEDAWNEIAAAAVPSDVFDEELP